MNDDDDGGFAADGGNLVVIVPTDKQWARADYLQLRPHNSSQVSDIESDHPPFPGRPLGTVKHYSIELVLRDNTMEFLYFGTQLDQAKTMIQALSARHDLEIKHLFPAQSDVDGY